MRRAHLAAIFALLWSAIQVWTLLLIGFYPWDRPVGWMLCIVALVISAGLWAEKSWARISSLILGSFLIIFYAVAQIVNPNSCVHDPSNCNFLLILSQPVLMLAMLAFVFKSFSPQHCGQLGDGASTSPVP